MTAAGDPCGNPSFTEPGGSAYGYFRLAAGHDPTTPLPSPGFLNTPAPLGRL